MDALVVRGEALHDSGDDLFFLLSVSGGRLQRRDRRVGLLLLYGHCFFILGVMREECYVFSSVVEVILELGVAIADMQVVVGELVVVGEGLDMPPGDESALV